MKLRCSANTRDFWNGEAYIQFVNGEYEASPQEAEHLLKCLGVEAVEGVSSFTPPPSPPPTRKRKAKK